MHRFTDKAESLERNLQFQYIEHEEAMIKKSMQRLLRKDPQVLQ